MPPDGAFDLASFRNIGKAYAYVEKIEAYGLGNRPYSNLGLWLTCLDRTDMTTPIAGVIGRPQKLDHDYVVTNMLMEAQRDFTVVGSDEDLAHYSCIILTGSACLKPQDLKWLERYVSGGGSLLVIGASALDPAKKRFVLDVGAKYVGPARHAIHYPIVDDPWQKEWLRLHS